MSGQRSRARRRPELSQHFLRRGALAASLIAHTSISSRDLVIEVGAGRGALTRELALRCGRVVAVEFDPELCRDLRAEFRGRPQIEVTERDFLEFRLPDDVYKVFENIPFKPTAEIIRRLVKVPTPPDDSYLVVQREAADRFPGRPYAPETLLSLLLKPWWHVEIARRLRRIDFDPPPSVDCVMLWLARRPRALVGPPQLQLYRDFVIAAFGRHGHTLREGLHDLFTERQIVHIARDLHFNASSPPSTLMFDQWLGLFRYFALAADEFARPLTFKEKCAGPAARPTI